MPAPRRAVPGTAAARARSRGRRRHRPSACQRCARGGARRWQQLGHEVGGAHVRILQQHGQFLQGDGLGVGRSMPAPAGALAPRAGPASACRACSSASSGAGRPGAMADFGERRGRARWLRCWRGGHGQGALGAARPRPPAHSAPRVAARPLSVCSSRGGGLGVARLEPGLQLRGHARRGRARRCAAGVRRRVALAAQSRQRPLQVHAGRARAASTSVAGRRVRAGGRGAGPAGAAVGAAASAWAGPSVGAAGRPAASNSKGLPTCSFMPAARQASRSAGIALAVIATMGSARGPRSRRIWRVAARPSITGICRSINTASKGGVAAATAATASCPSAAMRTCAPSSCSSSRTICWLLGLSSATSKRRPARRRASWSSTRACQGRSVATAGGSSPAATTTGRVMSKWKQLPWPRVLSSRSSPPISPPVAG